MAYRTVGKALPRVEGYGKVTGQTKYAADLPFEGLLWAKVLRSSVPHARIIKVDPYKAKALPGVRAVLTGADVKGVYVGTRIKDQPVLVHEKIRTAGDAIAAVAADTEAIADEATPTELRELLYYLVDTVLDRQPPAEDVNPALVPLQIVT